MWLREFQNETENTGSAEAEWAAGATAAGLRLLYTAGTARAQQVGITT